jgi:hypothetical protein
MAKFVLDVETQFAVDKETEPDVVSESKSQTQPWRATLAEPPRK